MALNDEKDVAAGKALFAALTRLSPWTSYRTASTR